MGSDHFRIISSSTTLNVSNVYKKLNTYLMYIDNYLTQENHSFAFHPKFGYLTSSIQELSGLLIIIHCTILNEYYQRLFENQLEKVQEHLRYSINSFQPSTMMVTNRPLLGLNDNEKVLRTIYATLIVLYNSQEKF
jgi:protein-arginine kinase